MELEGILRNTNHIAALLTQMQEVNQKDSMHKRKPKHKCPTKQLHHYESMKKSALECSIFVKGNKEIVCYATSDVCPSNIVTSEVEISQST